MSKFVKNLLMDDLKRRWDGVNGLLLVSLNGLSANNDHALRKQLRDKKIQVVMVKNSLARRATEGTALAAAFEARKGRSPPFGVAKTSLPGQGCHQAG